MHNLKSSSLWKSYKIYSKILSVFTLLQIKLQEATIRAFEQPTFVGLGFIKPKALPLAHRRIS